ncbi:hypothetical protein JTE90_029087 [Oedothorax gibbosus]|uniref:Uncharacterized protein n=1 Tax=Oedothorax gibbosus TaxID=931172 RepID=A0AAV6TE18_9ARAC|nr:hypothetical protein JTE90_029087 [Oedothorax gibbosus]
MKAIRYPPSLTQKNDASHDPAVFLKYTPGSFPGKPKAFGFRGKKGFAKLKLKELRGVPPNGACGSIFLKRRTLPGQDTRGFTVKGLFLDFGVWCMPLLFVIFVGFYSDNGRGSAY